MKKLKIYLDNCCFNRPYDNQDQLSIRLESEAKIAIQESIKNNKINLVGAIEMEKFIFLIQNNNFDYTKWRQGLFNDLTGEEISKLAMKNIENNTE